MGSTTRRVSEAELHKLKEIQTHLKQIGIDISQVKLSETITNYVLERFDDFIKDHRTKLQYNKQDTLLNWINTPFDGEEQTDAVKEHDVTH